MKIHELIDLIQRRINSLLFRLIILLYSLFILYINNNDFNLFIYIISPILYFSAYIYCLKHSKLRLLNDFAYIGLILLGKNPYDVLNFIFLVLPIINSINYSGQKKSNLLLYIYTFLTYLTTSCYYNSKYDVNHLFSCGHLLIPIFFLWIINSYTALRSKIISFRENLNEVVDSFYLRKEDIQKPYKIYGRLIEVIHKNIKSDLIESLHCFIISKDKHEKLTLINGSSFIWNYVFPTDTVKKVRERKVLINEPISIENKPKKYNLTLYSKVENQEFVFVFTTKTKIPIYYMLIGFFRTLQSPLLKISRILISEKKMQEIKHEELIKLSERSQYVSRANNTMHFIRNRLGPFSNLLTMIDNIDYISTEKIEPFNKLLASEKDRAKIELKYITERANNMLEKSNNPFFFNATKPYSIEKIFTILQRNFFTYFPDKDLFVNILPTTNKQYVLINEEGFELFLSDWLSNMKKYKKNLVSSQFLIKNNVLSIIFYNDYSNNIDEIKKMITDLKSNDRNEIMKRTTHGLYIIKSTLEDMNISFEILHIEDSKKVEFKLNLNIIENENSNI